MWYVYEADSWLPTSTARTAQERGVLTTVFDLLSCLRSSCGGSTLLQYGICTPLSQVGTAQSAVLLAVCGRPVPLPAAVFLVILTFNRSNGGTLSCREAWQLCSEAPDCCPYTHSMVFDGLQQRG